MQGLVDYWLGAKSNEVASGMLLRLAFFVDLMFFWWLSRWTFMVASSV